VVSLAAGFVILIAAGTYYNWFREDALPPTIVTDQLDQRSPSQQGTQQEESRANEDKFAKEAEKKPAPALGSAPTYRADKSTTLRPQMGDRKEVYRTSKNERQEVAAAAEMPESGIAALGKSQESDQIRLTDEAMVPPDQAFWVEGRIISEKGDLDHAGREKTGIYALSQEKSAHAKQKQDGYLAGKDAPVLISLDQKPASTLPPSQRLRQQQGTVQTFIQDRNGTLEMTLYLDSLVPAEELETADLEQVRPDSLILNIHDQRIGFRLPASLNEKVISKRRSAK
jgi:hypothetical protein